MTNSVFVPGMLFFAWLPFSTNTQGQVEIHKRGRMMSRQQRIVAMEALMKNQLILAAGIALALAGPAFAQDSYSSQPAQPAQTQPAQTDQSAPTDKTTQSTDQNTQSTDQTTQSTTTQSTDQTAEKTTGQTDQQTAEQNEAPSNQMTPVEKPVVQSSRRHCPTSTVTIAESVAPIISNNARQLTAANTYDPCKDAVTKVYPRVDRGHVEGDPPTIDHSSDIAPVTPTDSVASIPTDN
jgi:hypothetical protein